MIRTWTLAYERTQLQLQLLASTSLLGQSSYTCASSSLSYSFVRAQGKIRLLDNDEGTTKQDGGTFTIGS